MDELREKVTVHERQYFNTFDELCLDVMNGNDVRHLLLGAASTLSSPDNVDVILNIIKLVNREYVDVHLQ
jgi:hypothetical protein